MEQKRTILLYGAERFGRGALDNVTLDDGAILLDDVAGQHVLYGCYTSPEYTLPPFCSLNVSWNADTPAGTVIEAQCRVWAAGKWSGWKSFGKWSPDYPRRSVRSAGDSEGDHNVFIMGDTVTVAVAGGATAAQLRVFLYTDDEALTPSVRLLAASVRPLQWVRRHGQPMNRRMYLPEYDIASHDPSFGTSMDLPLTLAAMMNRYGKDVLPEELAYIMADGATADCRNAAYAAAAAGCMGFETYQAWMDPKDLRAEIRQGCAVAVEMEGLVSRDSGVVWMGLHGFGHDQAVNANYVLLNDPFATRGAVSRTMGVDEFERKCTGRVIVLHPGRRRIPCCRPLRHTCSLRPCEEFGTWDLEFRGEPMPLPDDFSGWLAASERGGPASATTAARKFCRIERTPSGGIRLPEDMLRPSARYTIFAVDAAGILQVAELQLPSRLPGSAPKQEPAAAGKSPAAQQ